MSLRLLLILLIGAGLLRLALLGMWGIKAVVNQHHADLERATLDMSRALASAVDAGYAEPDRPRASSWPMPARA